ncbi:hypothetical protein [Tissierella creatinophila]|uniref:Uncharacterized protein n=1 Tax=Tissierella creatinophila DSM 6911 TaxID=1123403 RepID=A0A1U7M6L3_TISCR|nr:hypothetical protein [Tissierella creatinophila]OLS02947.1 hypothetical protein TICRE_10040 [Tissierella creatinophila DSM 6911]
MKENKFLIISVLILSISIFVGSVLIANSIRDTNPSDFEQSVITNKGLITEAEAAEYLNLTHDDFKDLISTLESQREKLDSYETYRFIPFIQIDGIKYFNKEQLNKWIVVLCQEKGQIKHNKSIFC